ncbi:MAG: BolA/IbaG family iron-sulfur metabolism protein [Gammaproteobacteria bacterium]|nr:BolA/IbaG family iron-sulfur metabolism protein [Gammaproteobacteria bacterium]
MIEDLKSRLEGAFADAEVAVDGEGNRFEIHLVSAAFDGLTRVKRQQAVYAVIGDLISSGAVHAVTIRAMTPAERG